MTEGLAFRFAGEAFLARPSGALYWPAQEALLVADLHLGKSERMARRGFALLPPWEGIDTLERLGREIAALAPRHLYALGDSFDDDQAETALWPEVAAALEHLQALCRWHWIAGNHDSSGMRPRVGETLLGDIVLRHQAGEGLDISGHWHPVIALGGRRWRCFVQSGKHLILPAFGSYTGGMEINDQPFVDEFPQGLALICADPMFKAVFPNRFGKRKG